MSCWAHVVMFPVVTFSSLIYRLCVLSTIQDQFQFSVVRQHLTCVSADPESVDLELRSNAEPLMTPDIYSTMAYRSVMEYPFCGINISILT